MNNGDKVKIHYTGTFNDGSVFDSSQGREPLEFTIGRGEVIRGFEKAVAEMELSEEKNVKIMPSDAYGEKNEKLVFRIPGDKFPKDVQAGGRILLKSPHGQQIPATVTDIDKDGVLIDLNHPLAGKELNFKIKVVEVINY